MSEITIELPELHPDQVKAFEIIWSNRYSVVRAGRRWGKTDLGKVIAADGVINGEEIGWFAPDHKTWSEAFTELKELLDPIATRGTSKGAGVIRTKTRGRIDFWTLENQRAGRSRNSPRRSAISTGRSWRGPGSRKTPRSGASRPAKSTSARCSTDAR